MLNSVSEVKARKIIGKDFLDRSCSVICKCCGKSVFVLTPMIEGDDVIDCWNCKNVINPNGISINQR